MIDYSLTNNQREKTYYWMAAVSIMISSLLLLIDLKLIGKFILPSGFLIYGLFVQLFDKLLWKVKPISYLIKIPNLNGKWSGNASMTSGLNESLYVTITQTWKRIDIVVETDETIANVLSATFYFDNEKNKYLKYIYSIKPTKPDPSFNRYGEGCTELRYRNDNNKETLEGTFFSSKFRGGSISLIKQ